jgi:uncharacterized protein YjlB
MNSLEEAATALQLVNIVRHRIPSAGNFPNNNALSLLLFEAALSNRSADVVRELFESNRWVNSWVNGIYDYHHYHSTAHEVLAILDGYAQVMFGGPEGIGVHANQGDVIIIPAGVAHKCTNASDNFKVLGAYPEGQDYDILKGVSAEEKSSAEKNIKAVPLPVSDPVYGIDGPLKKEWL